MWNDILTWQIIAAIVAILALIVAILAILTRKRKKFGYIQIEKISLVDIKKEGIERIEILFDGKKVDDVSLILFKIVNYGNTEITENDFKKPISINFGDNSKVLDIGVEEKKPDDLDLIIENKEKYAEIKPLLLNRKDYIVFTAYVNNFKKLEIKTRITGVHKITDLTFSREIYKSIFDTTYSSSLGYLLYLKLKFIFKSKLKKP